MHPLTQFSPFNLKQCARINIKIRNTIAGIYRNASEQNRNNQKTENVGLTNGSVENFQKKVHRHR